MTRVVATSDLHGSLPEIPECDILVLGGDLCPDHPIGKSERYDLPLVGSEFQLDFLNGPFRDWLTPIRKSGTEIVAIAGNHDFVFERMRNAVLDLHLPWTFLEDREVTIDGLRIWGTPWVPGLPRWAFHGSDVALRYRAEEIPRGLDILISHGPPLGYLDFTDPRHGSKHVGDKALSDELPRIRPKVMVCGHIHEQYGKTWIPGGQLYNVCHNDGAYCPDNPPVLIEEFLTDEEKAGTV